MVQQQTPKKKAQELIDKFYLPNIRWGLLHAKKCALITIAFAKENPLNTDGYNKYLDEIKEEIENS
jgi:hypothetical protein